MLINLSEETIKTVCDSLERDKFFSINIMRNAGGNVEVEKKYRNRLAEVEDAMQIFKELSQ